MQKSDINILQSIEVGSTALNSTIFDYGMAIVNMGSPYSVQRGEDSVFVVSDDPIPNLQTGKRERIGFKIEVKEKQ
jgi:hypothetical protein